MSRWLRPRLLFLRDIGDGENGSGATIIDPLGSLLHNERSYPSHRIRSPYNAEAGRLVISPASAQNESANANAGQAPGFLNDVLHFAKADGKKRVKGLFNVWQMAGAPLPNLHRPGTASSSGPAPTQRS